MLLSRHFFIYLLLLLGFSHSINPLPTHIARGMCMFPFTPDTLSQPATLNELTDLASNNTQLIALSIYLRQDNISSTTITTDPEQTPSDDSITKFVQTAKSLGVNVFFKPIVVPQDGNSMYQIDPTNVSAWFDSYTPLVNHYASLAQSLDILAFSVGIEYYTLTQSSNTPYWSTVIKGVRSLFKGKLTYSALPYYEWEQIEFWGELDWIGIDAYFPLANDTDPNPPLADLVSEWDYWMQHIQSWRKNSSLAAKPVYFTELGYPSFSTCAVTPYQPPVGDSCTGIYAPNVTAQDLCYQALFTVVPKYSDMMGGLFMFWWDNPSSSDYYPNGKLYGCNFTPQGKPAQDTLFLAFELPMEKY